MAYLLDQETEQVLNFKDSVIIISKEWMEEASISSVGVSSYHAEIRLENNRYYLYAKTGRTEVGGQVLVPDDSYLLSHHEVIRFGDSEKGPLLIFYDEKQHQNWEESRQIRAITLDSETFTSDTEAISRDFFNKCPNDNLGNLAEYVVKFMVETYSPDSCIFFEMVGRRCKSLYGISSKPQYTPPHTILKNLWNQKMPQRFSVDEATDVEDISVSIVEKKVISALAIPILYDDEVIGILYLDTKSNLQNVLGVNELNQILTMIPGLSVIIGYLYSKRKNQQALFSLLGKPPIKKSGYLCFFLNQEVDNFFFNKEKEERITYLYFGLSPKRSCICSPEIKMSIYSTVNAISEMTKWEENTKTFLEKIHSFTVSRFPEIDISVGEISIDFSSDSFPKIMFSGYGREIQLTIKNPNRVFSNVLCGSYLNDSMKVRQEEIAFDFPAGSSFFLGKKDNSLEKLFGDNINVGEIVKRSRKPGIYGEFNG